jgi:hypothetical protein
MSKLNTLVQKETSGDVEGKPPPSDKSLDSLINAAKEFVRQLERIKLAGTHHDRAQGRPRQKATPKPSIDKTRFLAVLRAISKRVQAYIA